MYTCQSTDPNPPWTSEICVADADGTSSQRLTPSNCEECLTPRYSAETAAWRAPFGGNWAPSGDQAAYSAGPLEVGPHPRVLDSGARLRGRPGPDPALSSPFGTTTSGEWHLSDGSTMKSSSTSPLTHAGSSTTPPLERRASLGPVSILVKLGSYSRFPGSRATSTTTASPTVHQHLACLRTAITSQFNTPRSSCTRIRCSRAIGLRSSRIGSPSAPAPT